MSERVKRSLERVRAVFHAEVKALTREEYADLVGELGADMDGHTAAISEQEVDGEE